MSDLALSPLPPHVSCSRPYLPPSASFPAAGILFIRCKEGEAAEVKTGCQQIDSLLKITFPDRLYTLISILINFLLFDVLTSLPHFCEQILNGRFINFVEGNTQIRLYSRVEHTN